MLDVDCDVVAGDWDDHGVDWDGLADAAVRAALAGAGHAAALESEALSLEISIRLTDDEEVWRLNRDFRGKDSATNILSFPMLSPAAVAALFAAGAGDVLLGDLALALETLQREAAEKSVSPEAHFSHLVVHGTLHLLGHDHADDTTADAMEGLETAILAGIGIVDPYAARCDERS